MKKFWEWIKAFLEKYSFQVHIFLALWNSFMTSWATGLSIPLDEIGIPFSLDARRDVSFIQVHVHIPTWVIGVLTFLANATVAYVHWKKSHVKVVDVPAGSVLVAKAPVDAQVLSEGDQTIIKAE